jgi:hypothetical protein
MKYLGNSKILETKEKGENIYVKLKGEKKDIEMNKKLFDLIITEDLQSGELIEIIHFKVAREFLKKMVEYDLTLMDVSAVASHMENIMMNVKSEAVGKKFDRESELNLTVRDIFN